MKILKSIWTWLKANWISILAVIGVIFLLIYGYTMMNSLLGNDTSITDKLEQQEARHVKELSELNNIALKQQQAQEQLQRNFDQKMTELRIEFQSELEEIKKARHRRQTQLIQNPGEIGPEINRIFGIPQGN